MEYQQFYSGQVFDAYETLGAHRCGEGVRFCTFAPGARSISVIGEWNQWKETPMEKIYDGNFWECTVPDAAMGMLYKYRIEGADGRTLDHCDPYGVQMELRPNTASILCELSAFSFSDDAWMRTRTDRRREALNLYEMHLGSWRRKSAVSADWYSYRELADMLIPYLKENGWNAVEFMPLAEHPSDESWGYQETGFFSPTARYGDPLQLKYLVNACHQNGITVLLDFVPVHFAVDDYGLAKYDGTALYEYPHRDVGNSEWGSCNFMHSRGEVRSFLQSAANYWLTEYHIDGLRMDAISNMIYWQGNAARGVNQDAVRFLQVLNSGLKERHPTAILAAEDSTNFPGVTLPVEAGGLGFDYKWDMGWMNDTLTYFQLPPTARAYEAHKLTFSMQYFDQERYLLPLSHDEVVHGKGTIVQKMNGSPEEQLAQARIFYMYQFAHPGKKLNFMGSELGQLREWDEKREQDWGLLEDAQHKAFYEFFCALNRFYLRSPALWEQDYEPAGFRWLDDCRGEDCVFAFERAGAGQRMLAVFHFSDTTVSKRLKTGNGALRLLFASGDGLPQEAAPEDGSCMLTLPPFSAGYYAV